MTTTASRACTGSSWIRRVINITLAAREKLLTPVYALNRFLTLLIMEFLRRNPRYGSITHPIGSQLTEVSPGPPYTATLDNGELHYQLADLDEVIVRFGIHGNPPLSDETPEKKILEFYASRAWHCLPTHLPRT